MITMLGEIIHAAIFELWLVICFKHNNCDNCEIVNNCCLAYLV